MNRLCALVLVALVVPGCLDKAPVRPDPLPLERLTPAGMAYHSGLRDPLRVVVRDPAGLETLWKMAWGSDAGAPAVPEVDFQTHMVLVVALGERPSGGYAIQVGEVIPAGDGFEARIDTAAPGKTCAVTTVMTQPVDFASIPVRSGLVRFVDMPRVMECP